MQAVKLVALLVAYATATFESSQTDCYEAPLKFDTEFFRTDLDAKIVVKSNIHAVVYTKHDAEATNVAVQAQVYTAAGMTAETLFGVEDMTVTVKEMEEENDDASGAMASARTGVLAWAAVFVLTIFSIRGFSSKSITLLVLIGLAMAATTVESNDLNIDCATFKTQSRVIIVVTFPTSGDYTQDKVEMDLDGIPDNSVTSTDSNVCDACDDQEECVFGLTGHVTCKPKSGNADIDLVNFNWLNTDCKDTPATPVDPNQNGLQGIVIFAHGWQKDGGNRLSNPCWNYERWEGAKSSPPTSETEVTPWINAGWKVGQVHWERFADEGEVKNAEGKIWSPDGRDTVGMRYMNEMGYHVSYNTNQNVAQMLYPLVKAAIKDALNKNVRVIFAGHSLGSQVISHLAYKFARDPEITSTKKFDVWLLDAFFSKYGKKYLSGQSNGDVLRKTLITEIQRKGHRVHWTQSSPTNGTPFVGDSNNELRKMVMFAEQLPYYFPSTWLGAKHLAAYIHFFQSFRGFRSGTNPTALSTVKLHGHCWYQQENGAYSVATTDDRFTGGTSYRWKRNWWRPWYGCRK